MKLHFDKSQIEYLKRMYVVVKHEIIIGKSTTASVCIHLSNISKRLRIGSLTNALDILTYICNRRGESSIAEELKRYYLRYQKKPRVQKTLGFLFCRELNKLHQNV